MLFRHLALHYYLPGICFIFVQECLQIKLSRVDAAVAYAYAYAYADPLTAKIMLFLTMEEKL